MAAVPGFLSVEQFERLYTDDRKPYFEYWFGAAVQKSVPTSIHGAIQGIIFMLLFRQGWRTAVETRVKLSKAAFPVPDVIASASSLPEDYPTEPFDLCVEVLSPGDRLNSVFSKAAHYLDWGIGWVWIIDPAKRTAYVMSAGNPGPVTIELSGSLLAGHEGRSVVIHLGELFAEADRALGQHEAR